MSDNGKGGGTAVRPVTRDSALAMYEGMVLAIPEAPESDGSEIIADILASTDWAASAEAGKLPAGKELVGKRLLVQEVHRYASDIEGGSGWYLVADAVDVRTGAEVRFQTSAGALMAYLVKLHFSGALPATIEVTGDTTRRGYTAVSCVVIEASAPARALAQA